MKLTITTLINAPLSIVWDSFWKSEHIVHWCFASDDWHCPKSVSPEPQVGAIFCNTFAAKDKSFSFDFTARYDSVEPMKRIVYTIGEMKEFFLDAGRIVEITLEEMPDGIQFTETFDAEEVNSSEMQIAGWSAILENFRHYTENLAEQQGLTD